MNSNSLLQAMPIASISLGSGKDHKDSLGTLGVTFCPGKKDPMASADLGSRDLAIDLGSVRTWGASALVTLLDDDEFDLLDVARLGDMAEVAGLDWYHLPIPDMDVPGWQFERRWIYAGVRLRRLLRRGGKVVIHCRVGLGRSGMIAARLMVELGMSPSETISRIRKARPGAIQTSQQERHVLDTRKVPAAHDEAMARRLACLLGGAVGDGFGYVIEFDSLANIQKSHGLAGLREPYFHQGELIVSDDTQMSLFTLEGLTRAALAGDSNDQTLIAQVRLSYLDWLATQDPSAGDSHQSSRLLKHAVLHAQRAPGKTCISAMSQGGGGTPEQPINNSKGCGGIMRSGVIGLMPDMPPARAFRVGARIGALTHGHPSGYLPAGMMAACVRGLLENLPLHSALLQASTLARAWPGHEESVGLLQTALDLTVRPFTGMLPEELGQGWVGEQALAIAVYAASRSRSFQEMLVIAANHGGDSDSTASLAGQLFGAQHGLESLPHAWIRRLDVLDAALDLVDWTQPLWKRASRPAPDTGKPA
jgi:ADP-ribosylglycohydrolase/protein-tyrosine phosphatase